MPQLRQNIITGEWVVIAPERAKRPNDFVIVETVKPQSRIGCPFCLESDNYLKNRIKNFESPAIYVIPNKYPAFVETKEQCSPRTYHVENDFYHAKPSLGGHDVIIIKEHELNLFTFPEKIWVDMLQMFVKRYKYWRKDCNSEYAMAIYNEGQRAGASILHPHAQLFSSDIIPNQIVKEQHGAENYYEKYGRCIFCELITHEQKENDRVIYESDDVIAFTFYAARFPFETWVAPKQHEGHYENTTHSHHTAIAKCLMDVINKLSKTLQNPPLNLYFHDLPSAVSGSEYYHWHIELVPRLSNYGGFELGSGVVIDVMSPEIAAEYLKKVG